GQIERAPEKLHGRVPPLESRAMSLHDEVDLRQDPEESIRQRGFVRRTNVVGEGNRIGNLVGNGPDLNLDAQCLETGHETRVEVVHRSAAQSQTAAVAAR